MSRLFHLLLFLSLLLDSSAAVLNPQAALLARHARQRLARTSDVPADTTPSLIYPVIVRLDDADCPAPRHLTELCRRGDLLVATVDPLFLDSVGADPRILRLEASIPATLQMDKAREFCHVDPVHAATPPLPRGFDGSGVVVGMIDTGFDPNHINFSDPATGQLRVKRLINYSIYRDSLVRLDNPDQIRAWLTDEPTETHATHVAGIMAGSADTPYRGVAPGADIVAVTGPLYDAYILAGTEEIAAYARQVGKPAVVNVSIASRVGPHDGSSLFNQYVDRLTASGDATLCISAGNDGQYECSLLHTFSPQTPYLRTYPCNWDCFASGHLSEALDFWSLDANGFTAQAVLFDRQTQTEVALFPMFTTDDLQAVAQGQSRKWGIASADIAHDLQLPPDSILSSRTSGFAQAVAEIDPENGRFNIFFQMECNDSLNMRYTLGCQISGPHGQTVEVYGSNFLTAFWDPKASYGNSWRVINNLVCGPGVVSVGMMRSRDSYPLLSGQSYSFSDGVAVGQVSPHSSFGTLNDGRSFPHFCAPGHKIISSISRHYLATNPGELPEMSFSTPGPDGSSFVWGPMGGTSMSCPFTVGVFALWLQADPTLTPADLLQIATSTAIKPQINPHDPRWGAGTIDALAGLKHILDGAGIADVATDSPLTLQITPLAPATYQVLTPWPTATLTLSDLAGRLISQSQTSDGIALLNLDNYPPGIYILAATSPAGQHQSLKLVNP